MQRRRQKQPKRIIRWVKGNAVPIAQNSKTRQGRVERGHNKKDRKEDTQAFAQWPFACHPPPCSWPFDLLQPAAGDARAQEHLSAIETGQPDYERNAVHWEKAEENHSRQVTDNDVEKFVLPCGDVLESSSAVWG